MWISKCHILYSIPIAKKLYQVTCHYRLGDGTTRPTRLRACRPVRGLRATCSVGGWINSRTLFGRQTLLPRGSEESSWYGGQTSSTWRPVVVGKICRETESHWTTGEVPYAGHYTERVLLTGSTETSPTTLESSTHKIVWRLRPREASLIRLIDRSLTICSCKTYCCCI